MLPEQRAREILWQISQRRAVSMTDLCWITGVSKDTIRCDLDTLAQQGQLVKVNSGAITLEEKFLAQEPNFTSKQRCASEKERIAQYAASLVEEDNVVYLDTGNTVLHLAEWLKSSKAMFVTNSIELARRLSIYECRVYVLSGILKPGTMNVVGEQALEDLRRYKFTKAFLSTSGVSISQGFTTPDPEAAVLKTLAATQSRIVYMLADSSKFGRVTATTFIPLEAAQIITGRLPDCGFLNRTKVITV